MKRVMGVVFAAAMISSWAAAGGFGQYTTGGAGGTVVTPATPAEFKAYVETPNTPYIVLVQGTMNLESVDGKRVRIHSNKTVRGVAGTSPTIIGEVGFKNGDSNMIVERLTITNPHGWGEKDGLSIKEDLTNVLITKCTLYDCIDGLADITRRTDNVTVSWCRFYFTQPGNNNNRVSLVGGGDNHTSDEGKLHITFHHNWFGTNCWQRIPSVRYGRVHIYNNFYDCPGNLYGVRSRIKAECLIENNYFRRINDPYYVYVENEGPEDYGKIGASGNLFEDCTGVVHPGSDVVFAPPYAYTLDPAAMIPAIVQWGAGADGKDGYPPHWMFGGTYGDFDYSGLVDMADFAEFTRYWLATEAIENADYDGNGIVDAVEFLLFAENWMQLPPDETPPDVPQDFRALGQDGQITLRWSPNTEEDLDGYFIYRTTTWGDNYVRLNETPLKTAGYVDTNVVNETMYYYLVSAVDRSENESGPSLYGCARPMPGLPTLILQENALGFCSVQGIVDYGKHTGFTGAGFLDAQNSLGTGINWKINIAQAGAYTLQWRYANASGDRPGRLLLNGTQAIASISFPGTGAWNSWSRGAVTLTLDAGLYEIRLEGTLSDSLANIDYLEIIGDAPDAVACP